MFDVTSETWDNTSVIILKSRLTLQVILPARASLVTPSPIDDSTRPYYYRYTINRKRQRYTANEGMNSYRKALGHMEVRPDR